MTRTEKIALAYGTAIAGAALVSYVRGKRELSEIGMDALIHGGLIGTGANVVWWLYDEHQQTLTPVLALPNEGSRCESLPYGRVAAEGLALLKQIDPDILYKAAKLGAVTVAPAPDDVNAVVLPED